MGVNSFTLLTKNILLHAKTSHISQATGKKKKQEEKRRGGRGGSSLVPRLISSPERGRKSLGTRLGGKGRGRGGEKEEKERGKEERGEGSGDSHVVS